MLVVCKSLKNHLLISLRRCKIKYMRNIKQVYRNWPVHNLFAHPLSEVVYWILRPFGKSNAKSAGDWVHNITIPEGEI